MTKKVIKQYYSMANEFNKLAVHFHKLGHTTSVSYGEHYLSLYVHSKDKNMVICSIKIIYHEMDNVFFTTRPEASEFAHFIMTDEDHYNFKLGKYMAKLIHEYVNETDKYMITL